MEEMCQGHDRIREIDRPVVVRIRGILTGQETGPEEQDAKRLERIGHIDDFVAIGVAPLESLDKSKD